MSTSTNPSASICLSCSGSILLPPSNSLGATPSRSQLQQRLNVADHSQELRGAHNQDLELYDNDEHLRLDPGVFVTPCCSRLICAPCLSQNPRLSTYPTCMRRLSAKDFLSPSSSSSSSSSSPGNKPRSNSSTKPDPKPRFTTNLDRLGRPYTYTSTFRKPWITFSPNPTINLKPSIETETEPENKTVPEFGITDYAHTTNDIPNIKANIVLNKTHLTSPNNNNNPSSSSNNTENTSRNNTTKDPYIHITPRATTLTPTNPTDPTNSVNPNPDKHSKTPGTGSENENERECVYNSINLPLALALAPTPILTPVPASHRYKYGYTCTTTDTDGFSHTNSRGSLSYSYSVSGENEGEDSGTRTRMRMKDDEDVFVLGDDGSDDE